jgi:hypothetical protein
MPPVIMVFIIHPNPPGDVMVAAPGLDSRSYGVGHPTDVGRSTD